MIDAKAPPRAIAIVGSLPFATRMRHIRGWWMMGLVLVSNIHTHQCHLLNVGHQIREDVDVPSTR